LGEFLFPRGWIWGKNYPHRVYGFGYGIASPVPVSSRGPAIGPISKEQNNPLIPGSATVGFRSRIGYGFPVGSRSSNGYRGNSLVMSGDRDPHWVSVPHRVRVWEKMFPRDGEWGDFSQTGGLGAIPHRKIPHCSSCRSWHHLAPSA
jgi:hypothetical protein